MKKIIVVVLASLLIIGCTSLGDIKNSNPIYNGKFKGNYSYLARCVSKTMQQDDRWTIKALQYNVNVYPDIKTSEIQAYASGAYTGAIYAFEMIIKQKNTDTVIVELKGSKYEGGVAWSALNKCI